MSDSIFDLDSPKVVLREQLAALRDQDVRFREAWPIALEVALEFARATCTREDYAAWELAFAWTEDSWLEAYAGVPPSHRCKPPVLPEEVPGDRRAVMVLG